MTISARPFAVSTESMHLPCWFCANERDEREDRRGSTSSRNFRARKHFSMDLVAIAAQDRPHRGVGRRGRRGNANARAFLRTALDDDFRAGQISCRVKATAGPFSARKWRQIASTKASKPACRSLACGDCNKILARRERRIFRTIHHKPPRTPPSRSLAIVVACRVSLFISQNRRRRPRQTTTETARSG